MTIYILNAPHKPKSLLVNIHLICIVHDFTNHLGIFFHHVHH
uniref:Uncharacterized protein n=1 Tax=Rhizophora mucronata TaxID=61149 RepID=A0A2P2P771_RHIMU